jgi:hypothetical protein
MSIEFEMEFRNKHFKLELNKPLEETIDELNTALNCVIENKIYVKSEY